jgi:TRAP-type C4-dicarboxylate transport system permease small subunit
MEAVEVGQRDTLVRVHAFAERVSSLYVPGFLLVFMCLFITTEILARLTFNYSFIGVIDLAEQAVVMLTYLAIAGVQRRRGHITMDLLPNKLSSRRAGPILDSIFLAIGIATMIVLLIMVYFYWVEVIAEKDQLPTLVWPKWPFVIAMPLGIFFMLLRLVIQFIDSFLIALGRKPLRAATHAPW